MAESPFGRPAYSAKLAPLYRRGSEKAKTEKASKKNLLKIGRRSATLGGEQGEVSPMNKDLQAEAQLWVSGVGDHARKSPGRKDDYRRDVPNPLIDAAQRTWRDALAYATRHLGDTARAANVVDSVVRSAAKAHRQKPIERPQSYLLSGVRRRVKKLLAREQRIEYVGGLEELENFKAAQNTDWVADLDNRILLEEIIGFMDQDTRRLLFRWVRDDDWEDIAADLGISINTAQHRLRYGIEKARRRAFQSGTSEPKRIRQS